MSTPAHEHNRRAWDALVQRGNRFTRPVTDEELSSPLATVDDCGWLGPSLRGKNVLCLAAGGGKHSLLYAAAGANVTVVDLSPAMLALDRQVAAERSISVRVIERSMDDLSPLSDGEFDIVIHPVSTCYVPDVKPVFAEVARITAPGGLYISQHKQPSSLQTSSRPSPAGYIIQTGYYEQAPLPAEEDCLHREAKTLEFLHTLEELIGGMCRAGFIIEDLVEPLHAKADAPVGSFGHRSQFVPPYLRMKARRVSEAGRGSLWMPPFK